MKFEPRITRITRMKKEDRQPSIFLLIRDIRAIRG